jgi:hypothetical protein
VGCTHGPDPAPDGIDVTNPPPIPSISQEAAEVATASLDCQGDGTSGPRVQLVYARPASAPDRYHAMAANFQMWAAQIDDVFNDSAAETGGIRRVRYVHDPSCQPIVARVQLTDAGDDNLANTINELRSQGYNRSDRKYLVWMDSNVYCGIAQVYEDSRPGSDNPNNGRSDIAGMAARVDKACWGLANMVEAHELVHALGAVQQGAPNVTRNGHCTDEHDRMCYTDAMGVTTRVVCSATSHENRLDCNHDDYFSTAPPTGNWLATHWNTANSVFLSATPKKGPPDLLTGVWRPSTGEWYVRNSTQGYPAWGQVGDVPVPGDYDGNRRTDIAVYRVSTGVWYVRDSTQPHPAWGITGDVPVPGDYDGNGTTDMAVYRPTTGEWFVRNSKSGYPAWGITGDVPVPGDYDGNGTTDIAVYRPTTGVWYIRNSTQPHPAWGMPGDVPVPGDYDGNGTTDMAVYRPTTGEWFVRNSTWGYPAWGILGDIPVPSDYDGNGTTDMAVYRPGTGEWFFRNLDPGYAWWGITGDEPLPLTLAVRELLL